MRAAAAALASGAAVAVLAIALRRRRKGDPFDERIDAILAFWFGGHTFCARAELGRKLWFARGSDRDAADDVVRRRFAEVVREEGRRPRRVEADAARGARVNCSVGPTCKARGPRQ